MVNTQKINFTIPEDVARELKSRVKKSKRSAFVVEAVRDKLENIKRQQLEQELIEGYQVRRDEGEAINKEWEEITLENWD
jgi:metal-responsive CopG/Arc/MetJ family transcriptional regulator